MFDQDEYQKLLSNYGFKDQGRIRDEKHYIGLKYIEKYERKFGKEVWFPSSEITSEHFFGMVRYDEGSAIHINSDNFYYKMLEGILKLPWLLLRFHPWGDVIVDNIYYCFDNYWQGTDAVCVLALDFTTAISTQKIGRNDDGEELVYFCNGLVLRDDGAYKFIHRAFTDPKERGFGYNRFGLSRSAGETKVISTYWNSGVDIRIPTYYELSDFKNEMDDRLLKINLRAGFPKKGELVRHSQEAHMKHPGSILPFDLFNPADEYSIYNDDLDPLYQKLFELT